MEKNKYVGRDNYFSIVTSSLSRYILYMSKTPPVCKSSNKFQRPISCAQIGFNVQAQITSDRYDIIN